MILNKWSFSFVFNLTCFLFWSSLTFNVSLKQSIVKKWYSFVLKCSSTYSISISNQCLDLKDFPWNKYIFLGFPLFFQTIIFQIITTERIQDSLWKNSSVWLGYTELRTRLKKFEIFVSSFIHKKNIENCIF